MRTLIIFALLKLIGAVLFITSSYLIVVSTYFSYLFLGNILLLVGLVLLVEVFVLLVLLIVKKWRERKATIQTHVRTTFIVLFITDVVIRLTGVVNTYPENTDGNYFSLAQQEQLSSWYWVHTPNTHISNQKKEFLFERDVNSIGLSEKEIAREKGNNFRILAIGDSFTEGVGMAYDSTWVKNMELRWKKHDVQTINAGIGGSDPLYEFVLFRDKLAVFSPDLVVLTINSSDITDVCSRGGFERFHTDGTAGKKPPYWEWVYASNHLFRMILHSLFQYNSSLVRGTNSSESQIMAVESIKEAIGRFKAEADRCGAKLLVVLQPAIQDFDNGKHIPFFGQQSFADYMIAQKIDFVDVSKTFEQKGGKVQRYYYPIDTHFNDKGYSVFGNAVCEKIEELNVF